MGNPLEGIVHHHRQLISEQPVGTSDDEVADLTGQVLLQLTLDAIVNVEVRIRDAHAPGTGASAGRQALAAGAGVDDVTLVGARRLRELATGAGTRIDRAARVQRIECRGIGVVALRLIEHRAIPVQAVGVELAQDGVGRAGFAARPVEIFHPDQPASAGCAGVKPAGHGGHERADMQEAGGRRCKASDIGCVHPGIMPCAPRRTALTGRCRAAPSPRRGRHVSRRR